jgi:hypothetical protein
MKDEKEDELEEAKDLFKEGLKKIFQATKKVFEKATPKTSPKKMNRFRFTFAPLTGLG